MCEVGCEVGLQCGAVSRAKGLAWLGRLRIWVLGLLETRLNGGLRL